MEIKKFLEEVLINNGMENLFCCELHFLIFGVCCASVLVLMTIFTIIYIVKELIKVVREDDRDIR